MQLYIIRHAQSTNNALFDPRERVCDPPLTELGRRQAQILAEHLATGHDLDPYGNRSGAPGYGFDQLWVSPMWRALQTAQPIARALGLRVRVRLDIHEQGGIFLDHGAERGRVGYPGRLRSEVLAEFPDYDLPDQLTDAGWWRQGYEPPEACFVRAAGVLAELRGRAAGEERIALLTHGAFIDAFLKALFGQALECPLFYYSYNTAISRLQFHADGRIDVHYLNRVTHLPLALVS